MDGIGLHHTDWLLVSHSSSLFNILYTLKQHFIWPIDLVSRLEAEYTAELKPIIYQLVTAIYCQSVERALLNRVCWFNVGFYYYSTKSRCSHIHNLQRNVPYHEFLNFVSRCTNRARGHKCGLILALEKIWILDDSILHFLSGDELLLYCTKIYTACLITLPFCI